MSVGHTPGPWEFDGDWHRLPTIFGAGGVIIVAYLTKTGSPNRGSRTAEQEANARLIAAAPALLEACKSMLPRNLCLTNSNVRDDTVVPLETTMGELRKIAAAIARARGEQA